MGWLLDIARFAQRTKFKCTRCGSEAGVEFTGDAQGMHARCLDCGASSRFDPRDLKPDAVPELPAPHLRLDCVGSDECKANTETKHP